MTHCQQQRGSTFENTVEALELSGVLLNKVSAVFFNLHWQKPMRNSMK